MQEKNIGNHLHRDTLTGRTHNTVNGTRRQQAPMACGQRLPYTSQRDQDRERQTDGTTAEDVAERNDNEVGESEGDDSDTGQHAELHVVEMKFLAEEWEHGRDGEGAGYADPGEDPLTYHNHYCFD